MHSNFPRHFFKVVNCSWRLVGLWLCYPLGVFPKPPKTLLKSINKLTKRDDIVITKPDKGSGVVVMDKSDYVRLLCEASINDPTKFTPVGLERPSTKGRSPKYYHPLFEKEKYLESVVRRILPEEIADCACKKSSRLAHLYGLRNIRPIKKVLPCDPFCLQQIHTTTLWQSGWTRSWDRYLSTSTRYPTSFNSSKRSNIYKSVTMISGCRMMSQPSSLTFRWKKLFRFIKESIQWELV